MVNIMINRMMTNRMRMTMVHHVSHMWILLHVVKRHVKIEDSLKTEWMTCHMGMW